MISKDEVLYLMNEETAICKHLFSKIPEDAMDFRPSTQQRSILELLQYLSYCGYSTALGLYQGHWDHMSVVREKANAMTASEFPNAMDEQMENLRILFAEISDDEWNTKTIEAPFGNVDPVNMTMMFSPARFMTAYRMQLFLYIKAAGVADFGTEDCWLKRS